MEQPARPKAARPRSPLDDEGLALLVELIEWEEIAERPAPVDDLLAWTDLETRGLVALHHVPDVVGPLRHSLVTTTLRGRNYARAKKER